MGTVAEKLNKLLGTKAAIKAAIIEKGQEAGDVFADYPDKIRAIESGATPTISVDQNGLITATSGSKSVAKQLTVKAAETITPGVTDRTIASGQYLTGDQMILGDANLLAENIKSGVSIFGVAGSATAAMPAVITCTVVNNANELIDVFSENGHDVITETAQSVSIDCPSGSLIFVVTDAYRSSSMIYSSISGMSYVTGLGGNPAYSVFKVTATSGTSSVTMI